MNNGALITFDILYTFRNNDLQTLFCSALAAQHIIISSAGVAKLLSQKGSVVNVISPCQWEFQYRVVTLSGSV